MTDNLAVEWERHAWLSILPEPVGHLEPLRQPVNLATLAWKAPIPVETPRPKQEISHRQRVREYLEQHPGQKFGAIAKALNLSNATLAPILGTHRAEGTRGRRRYYP